MKTQKLFAQLALAFVVIACNPTEGPSHANASPVSAQSTCRVGADEDPFACFAKKCVSAGGRYLAFNQTCDCGEEKVFVGWGGGSCKPVETTSGCLRHGFADVKSYSMESFIECLTLSQSEGTSVHLTPVQNGGNLDTLADWADRKLPAVLSTIIQQPTLFQMLSVQWLVGPGSFDVLDEVALTKLTTPFTVLLIPPKESSPVQISYYFEKNDNLVDLFTPADEQSTVSVESTRDPRLLPLRDAVAALLKKPFEVQEKQYFTDDGCAGHCQLRQHIQENGIAATRKRDYAGGLLLSDQVLVWESPERERANALVQLLPSGQISLVHSFERGYVESSQTVTLRYQIYDRHWKPLLSKPRERTVLESVGSFLEALKKTKSAQEDEPQAVLCESGFDLETLGKLGMENFALGPLRSRSFLGWVDSGRNFVNWGDFVGKFALSGISEFTDVGSRLAFVGYSDHALKVGRKLTGYGGDIRILPISLGTCSDHGERWVPQVKAHSKAKAVNWSAALSYTKGACESSSFGRQIRAHEKDLVYVVAAGNDGLNGDAQAIPICPQSLSGAPNLIVVAAGVGRSLSHVSNHGASFADIVADSSHEEAGPQSYTTSIAAPAVTGIVARLAYAFPNLSPERLRKAVLLGADIPTSGRNFAPLPVRSGGWLDANLAHAFATQFTEEPNVSDQYALWKVFCKSARRQNCALLDQRIQILKARKLLEAN